MDARFSHCNFWAESIYKFLFADQPPSDFPEPPFLDNVRLPTTRSESNLSLAET